MPIAADPLAAVRDAAGELHDESVETILAEIDRAAVRLGGPSETGKK